MEASSCISALTLTNWQTWKVDMKVLLMHHGCWSFIEVLSNTEFSKEIKSVSSDGSSTTERTEVSLSYKDKLDLELRKNRAYTLIYLNVCEEIKPLISSTTDGCKAWKILKSHFEPVTRARIVQLLDDFFETKYQSGEIGIFLCHVKAAATRLREAGHEVDNLYLGFQMIRYLPSEFQPIIQQIYRWPDSDFTPEKIEAELLLESNRLQLVKVDVDKAQSAFFSKDTRRLGKAVSSNTRPKSPLFVNNGRGKTKNSNFQNVNFKSKFDKSTDINNVTKSKTKIIGPCYRCHKTGHLIKNCKQLPSHRLPESNNLEVRNSFYESECSLLEIFPQQEEANNVDRFDNSSWIVDTAATAHFCCNRNLFLDFKPVSDIKMKLAVGEKESPVVGVGSIHFFVKHKGEINEVVLKDVLYNPDLRRNLLSGSKLDKEGANLVITNGKMKVFDKNWNELFFAVSKDNLYFFKPIKYKTGNLIAQNVNLISTNCKISGKNTELSKLWHERYCHVNNEYLVSTSKNDSVRGLPSLNEISEHCIPCKLGKSRKVSFKKMGAVRSNHPLQLLHMDVCGPMPVVSQGGNRYFLSIIDDFSRKVTVFPIRNKSDVFQTFVRYQKRVERFLDRKVIAVRSDGGLEFCCQDFERFLEKQGIKHEVTNFYTPQQNGTAERYNLTALNGVKTLLNSSGLPNKFWGEALLSFTYCWNRICHKGSNKTPFELFSNHKPSVSHLKIFGCLAYVGVPKQLRKKLDMRAKLGIMMGYAQKTKGYRIWLKDEHKLIETINVNFDESKKGVEVVLRPNFGRLVGFDFSIPEYDDDENISSVIERLTNRLSTEEQSVPSGVIIPASSSSDLTPCTNISWVRKVVPRRDGSRNDIYYGIKGTNTRLRSFNDVEKYCDKNKIKFDKQIFDFRVKNDKEGEISAFNNCEEANIVEVKVPRNYNEAVKSPESVEWENAMNQEIKVMHERKVWELVDPPKDKAILGNRWVYTLKYNEKNEIVRYKARLVVQGFSQIKGDTYDEVFSPVVNFSIIRVFFSIYVCLFRWTHRQIDINNAYLYAKLDEVIYMKQPFGYVDDPSKVCILRKAIYGLHQSGRQWFFELDEVLLKLNFVKLSWCNCVYSFKDTAILLFYVDDIVILGKTEKDIDFVVTLLEEFFNLKILGYTKKLLGIEFEQTGSKLFIHQKSYIEKVCNLYKRYNFPVSSLPMSKGQVLTKLDSPNTSEEFEEMSKLPYRNLIGCLAFIASRTRPDIVYSVNVLSQFQNNPGINHWNSLLKLLGYVSFTRDYKLELSAIENLSLRCFSDADFAANRDDRVSLGGYILFLDRTPISWRTAKQKCISLSTMEAEYVSLTEAAKELIWLKNVLENQSLNLTLNECILFSDNQAAISFSKSPVENARTKHIHIKYLFLRDLVYSKTFKLKYVKSSDNEADIFTKPLVREQLLKFCKIFEI